MLANSNFFFKKWKNKNKIKSHNNIEKNIGSIKPIFSILKLMEKGDFMTKKILSIIAILALLFLTLQINVFAASVPLGSVTVDVSKEKIAPGEEVTVTINFGTDLGAYTFDVAYDNNIFEYVRSEGGTENDNGTRVRVTFYDGTGGTNPRTNMSVTFKAKEAITTTNPTDFSVTGEGLANADASQEYDDITTPIKKDVTVEPNYVDYTIRLNYSGKVLVDEEKDMELITESSMGRNYDHVKLTVEVTKKPSDNATVKLLATTNTRQEVDLIQDGYGDPDGYALGGKDVSQVLDIRGLFSEIGEYGLKVSLLDKDSGDAVIASQDFNINVEETATEVPGEGNNEGNNDVTGGITNEETPGENITGENNQNNTIGNEEENLPENLPKTGMTQYVYIITAIAVLGSGYIALKNTKKE